MYALFVLCMYRMCALHAHMASMYCTCVHCMSTLHICTISMNCIYVMWYMHYCMCALCMNCMYIWCTCVCDIRYMYIIYDACMWYMVHVYDMWCMYVIYDALYITKGRKERLISILAGQAHVTSKTCFLSSVFVLLVGELFVYYYFLPVFLRQDLDR